MDRCLENWSLEKETHGKPKVQNPGLFKWVGVGVGGRITKGCYSKPTCHLHTMYACMQSNL